MYEATVMAYDALFEAGNNARKALHKCREELRNTGFSDDEAARIMHEILHCFFYIFADDPSQDAIKLPEVKEKLRLIRGAFELAMGLGIHTPSGLERCKALRPHFKTYVLQNFDRLDNSLNIVATKTGNILHPCNVNYIASLPPSKISATLTRSPAPNHTYEIVHIPSHAAAMQYADVAPWCLCWPTMQHWSSYTNHGNNKCYFALRDDYKDYGKKTSRSPSNPDDEYGRSMIGFLVKPDGSIGDLYNRWNTVDNIYEEGEMSQLLGRNFRSACPPYTPEEAEKSRSIHAEEMGEAAVPSFDMPDRVNEDNFMDTLVRYSSHLEGLGEDDSAHDLHELLAEIPCVSDPEILYGGVNDDYDQLARVRLNGDNGRSYGLIMLSPSGEFSQIGTWSSDPLSNCVYRDGDDTVVISYTDGTSTILMSFNRGSYGVRDNMVTYPLGTMLTYDRKADLFNVANPDGKLVNVMKTVAERLCVAVPFKYADRIVPENIEITNDPSDRYLAVIKTANGYYVTPMDCGMDSDDMEFICHDAPNGLVPASRLIPNGKLKGFALFVENLDYPGDGGYIYNPSTGECLNTFPWAITLKYKNRSSEYESISAYTNCARNFLLPDEEPWLHIDVDTARITDFEFAPGDPRLKKFGVSDWLATQQQGGNYASTAAT